MVENDTMHTGLANVLQNIKENVRLDVFQLRLVELTSAKIADKRMPIFVFEAKEEGYRCSFTCAICYGKNQNIYADDFRI